MSWPSLDEAAEALRHPRRCFSDAELRRGQPTLAAGGPLFRPGTLADAFQVRAPGGVARWAVKFYRQETPALEAHYLALAEHLLPLDLPWLAAPLYLDRGLCVGGRWFPAVKMPWLDGAPLHAFVEQHADRPELLRLLVHGWVRLSQGLRAAGLAHGALQHEHILVSASGGQVALRLIDYDAMFFAARAGAEPIERGHPAYEHPRQWQQPYDAETDRFSQLLVYVSLLAVCAAGRDLWQRYHGGDNLIFREADFQEPGASPLLGELWRSPLQAVRALAARLLLASRGKPADVPLLSEIEAQAAPPPTADPCDVPQPHLTAEEREEVAAILGAPDAPAEPRKTFGIYLEPGTTALGGVAGEFDLVIDDEPGPRKTKAEPPPLPPSTLRPPTPLPEAVSEPPPLPPASAPAPPPPADPRTAVYKIQAWMPEQIAVMKLRGFVNANTGEVVSNAPGLLRVYIYDPYELANPPRPGLGYMLGFVDAAPPPPPRVLAVLDFYMDFTETNHQKLLDITLHVSPADGSPPQRWRRYCDNLFCEVRGYLMGNR